MARTVPIGPSGADPYAGKLGYIQITCPTGGGSNPVDSPKISNNTGVHQGLMSGFKVVANNCTNAITFSLGIIDRDGDLITPASGIWTGIAKNATTIRMYPGDAVYVPLIEQEKIRITPSGEPGDTPLIVKVTLYYLPDADIIAWGYR
jgi:hypothetical protein